MRTVAAAFAASLAIGAVHGEVPTAFLAVSQAHQQVPVPAGVDPQWVPHLEAVNFATKAAAIEQRAAAAEAMARQAAARATQAADDAMSSGKQINAAVQEALGYETRASVQARSARISAQLAKKALDEARLAAGSAADEAASEAAESVKEEALTAEKAAAALEAKFDGTTPPPISEGAVRAMAPLYENIGRQQKVWGLYRAQAEDTMAAAHTLQDNSRKMAAMANAWQSVGDTSNAAKMMDQAHGMMDQARGMAGEASRLAAQIK